MVQFKLRIVTLRHFSVRNNKKSLYICFFLAQLFSTNVFGANTFSLNVLSTFIAIYSQSTVNTNNFFTTSIKQKQISWKYLWIYWDKTNSLGVVGLEVLGLNLLVLNSCAFYSYYCLTCDTLMESTQNNSQLRKHMASKCRLLVPTKFFQSDLITFFFGHLRKALITHKPKCI